MTGLSGSNTIANSTITLNSATNGIGSTGNGVGQGGGIFRDARALALRSTIVAQNVATGFGHDVLDSGGGVTAGFNLIGNGEFSGVTAAGNNQVGTSGAPIDPELGPLQDNGGPTPTRMPNADSPLCSGRSV